MRPYLASVLTSLAIALLMYFLAVKLWGSVDFSTNFKSMNIEVWAIVLVLSLLNYVLRFYRWTRYISLNAECSLPVYQHLLVYFAGFALTTTPGKAGEALRSIYLSQSGVNLSHSLSALFAERLVDLMTIVLLAFCIIDAATESTPLWSIPIVFGITLSIFALVHSDLLRRVLHGLAHRSTNVLNKLFTYASEMLESSQKLLMPKEMMIGSSLGLVAWLAEGVGFYVILVHLDIELSIATAIGIYGIAMLAGAISFIPGGLGSTELVMGGLLIALGADQSAAITATLVCRIATLWFAVALGMVSAAILTALGITPKLTRAAG